MGAYKSIVTAIDIGGGYEQVLSQTADLMKCYDASVTILNVVHFPLPVYADMYGGGLNISSDDYDYNGISTKLMPELERLVKKYDLPPDCVLVDFGRPVDVILDVAEKKEADLIVVGSHGTHGIGLLLGSTANGVLHRAKCDVLAIRIKE